MAEKKYTSDGLPIVSKETIIAFIDKSRTTHPHIAMGEFGNRLKTENYDLGCLLDSIKNDAQRAGISEENIDYIFIGAMVIYESLRKQAGANKLEKELR